MTLLMFGLSATIAFSQKLTQTIRGTVMDNDSKLPLIGASVILPNSSPFTGTTTDVNGLFRLTAVPIGRTSVRISYMGYETVTIPNIEVNTGKEVVLNISLQESATKLNEVVITTDRKKGEAINDMAPISLHSITPEETKRFTGGMDDPARVVSCYAGVASTPDGSSDIIVRGNAPKYMQWRLEGNEISSPYHMDDQNSSFGALTALNNNLLSTSDFYTGAFSAEYGDVLSSIYDVKLRPGNNEKFEANAGIGLMGTELTLEGPFRKGYSGSYLVNYRFSTISLAKKLGLVDVEGAVSYQDMTFKVVLPSKNAGTFSFFGLGGLSGVSMDNMGPSGLSTPGSSISSALVSKDFEKSNYLGNAGITHVIALSSNSFLRTSLNYSRSGGDDDVYETDTVRIIGPGGEPMGDSVSGKTHTVHGRIANSVLRGSVMFNTKLSRTNKLQAGINYDLKSFRNNFSQYDENVGILVARTDLRVNVSVLHTFISWKHTFNDHLTLVAGIHNLNVIDNAKSTLEPRISLSWKIDPTNSLHFGYGMHSTTERIHNYYARVRQDDGTFTEPNRNLGLLKAHHVVAGYEKRFTPNLVGKIEAYYQYLYNLPVENDPGSYYCTINEGIDYRYVELVNKGVGQNYGVEISVERFFDNNYYFLGNASLFDSKYKSLEGVWRNTRYNNNYIVNLIGGKEFRNIGRKNNQTLALNAKLFFEGGQRYIPLLRDANGNVTVDPAEEQYYDYDKAYDQQLDRFFSLNLSASYKFNRPKTTHEIFLDLMNVTNNKSRMAEYYDPGKPGNVGYSTQFGFFPNLMYRIYL